MGVRLFVGNLNPRTTPERLDRFLSSAGLRVVSVRAPVDRENGRRRGFAFVEFGNHEDAERALTVFTGRDLDGQRLRIGWAREREDFAGRWTPPKPTDVAGGTDSDALYEGGGLADGRWSAVRDEDYTHDRARRIRGRGKHGSDRRHRVGTRRRVD